MICILSFYLVFFFFTEKSETLPQADQEKAREQAKCLGFVEPPQFIYKQAGWSTTAYSPEY